MRIEPLEDRLAMTYVIGGASFDQGVHEQVAQNSTDQELSVAQHLQGEISSVGPAEFGSVELTNDGKLLYTPNADFVGVDSFNIQRANTNTQNSTSDSTLYVNVTESVYALPDWIRVSPGNAPVTFDVLANDYLYEGRDTNDAILTHTTEAQFGSVSINHDGTQLVYTPSDDFAGIDAFTYTVRDAYGNESSATANVEVSAVDSGTFANADHFFIDLVSQRVKSNASLFGSSVRGSYWKSYGYVLDSTASLDLAVRVPIQDSTRQLFPIAQTATSSRSSATNMQTAGVDEGDIVKQLGDYLYIAAGNELRIVDVRDAANPTLAETMSFDDEITDLYAAGDRLTVIAEQPALWQSGWLWSSATLTGQGFSVHVLDVSDSANITTVYTTEVDGDYRDSRFIDGILYVVSDDSDWLSDNTLQVVESSNGRFYESVSEYVGRLNNQTNELGQYKTTDASGTTTEHLFEWTDLPVTVAESNSVGSIITFDTMGVSGKPIDADVFETSGRDFQIYASTEAIYLLSDVAVESENTGITDQRLVFNSLFWQPTQMETKIQKFSFLSDGAGVDFAASGSVTGKLSDQFSADEHDETFRIATTGDWGGEVSLFVMAENGDSLDVVGSLTDIAPGERIYSTRFDGDRVFVTTYRKVDPLFVIDLSDPATPTITGELKIPSYSNYMRVIDDDYVLGIGRDANDGLYDGLQISLFNVSDPSDPQLVAKYEFAGGRDTWSPIADAWNLLDPLAVTFVAESGVLAIPTYSSSRWGGGGTMGTDNAISVLNIDIENESITLLGDMEFDERANRSLHIDGYLYGISDNEIQVSGLLTPDAIEASIDFASSTASSINDVVFSDLSDQTEQTEPESAATDSTPQATSSVGDPVTDVNNDGETTPSDAIRIVNRATEFGFGPVTDDMDNRLDVNGDGQFAPVDLIIVFNKLNETTAAKNDIVSVPQSALASETDSSPGVGIDADEAMKEELAKDKVFEAIGAEMQLT